MSVISEIQPRKIAFGGKKAVSILLGSADWPKFNNNFLELIFLTSAKASDYLGIVNDWTKSFVRSLCQPRPSLMDQDSPRKRKLEKVLAQEKQQVQKHAGQPTSSEPLLSLPSHLDASIALAEKPFPLEPCKPVRAPRAEVTYNSAINKFYRSPDGVKISLKLFVSKSLSHFFLPISAYTL